MDVYIEPLGPVDRLYIFGAGHVAKPTAAMATMLGFDVTVIDERDELATPERFPGCTLHTGDPRAFAETLATDDRTYLFVTTHDHALDQALLERLIGRPYAWLGLIGSRAKLAKFFVRLRQGGVDEALFSRVSGPVGLDIGAQTPEEIAVSVVAEMVRVRRGSAGIPRSLGEDPLPARGGDGVAHPPGLRARA